MGKKSGESFLHVLKGCCAKGDDPRLDVPEVSPHCIFKERYLAIMIRCSEQRRNNLLLLPTWGISLEKGIGIRQGSSLYWSMEWSQYTVGAICFRNEDDVNCMHTYAHTPCSMYVLPGNHCGVVQGRAVY